MGPNRCGDTFLFSKGELLFVFDN